MWRMNGSGWRGILSSSIHYQKPEPEIFQTALEKLGVSAEDCIFIENSVRNLTDK